MAATEAISRLKPSEGETVLSTVDSFRSYEALKKNCRGGFHRAVTTRCGVGGCASVVSTVVFEVDRIGWSWENVECFSVSANKKLSWPPEVAEVAKVRIGRMTRPLHADFGFMFIP